MTTLTPLELALGQVLGRDVPAAVPDCEATRPGEALERPVLDALQRPPCLVSFSGGRDSSAVLAFAARLARREGLPEPIPATIRAPDAPLSDEGRWQELVVAHVGVRDWVRLEFRDELDVVGPLAQGVLSRHGLLWPFNAHFHVPLFETAGGGAVLTGVGGDELFAAATSRRAAAVLTGRVSPVARDLRRITLHAAPASLRRWWYGRRDAIRHPWLTPLGEEAARREYGAAEAAEPRRMAPRLRHVRAARYLRVGTDSLRLLAEDAGAMVVHPLLDAGMWASVARWAPPGGYLGRTDAMREIFGHLLPAELLARHDKAGFDEVFFHRHSRELAATWAGAGVPAALVDAGALRAHWLGASPRAQSFSLLQAAWLASAVEGRDEAPGGGVEHVPTAGTAQPQHRQ